LRISGNLATFYKTLNPVYFLIKFLKQEIYAQNDFKYLTAKIK